LTPDYRSLVQPLRGELQQRSSSLFFKIFTNISPLTPGYRSLVQPLRGELQQRPPSLFFI